MNNYNGYLKYVNDQYSKIYDSQFIFMNTILLLQ
jgi:hypothetical protein